MKEKLNLLFLIFHFGTQTKNKQNNCAALVTLLEPEVLGSVSPSVNQTRSTMLQAHGPQIVMQCCWVDCRKQGLSL